MSATETKRDEFRRYGNVILAGDEAKAYVQGWQPIETYDRDKGATVVLLDWFTYRTDPAKKLNPVRYVGAWSDEYGAWFDDDGMDLDIEPTHWLPLPNVPEGGR